MAKTNLEFLDFTDDSFIKVDVFFWGIDDTAFIKIQGFSDGNNSDFTVFLDKSTAIKFAKTLRTEINKIVE